MARGGDAGAGLTGRPRDLGIDRAHIGFGMRQTANSSTQGIVMAERQFQVAITFASEQRPYAEALARNLSRYGIAYFYDAEHEAALWGKHLAEEFNQIYSRKSQYVLMLISEAYINKQWCRHERRSAISEALTRDHEFILPIRFDNSWPDGLARDLHYFDANKKDPAEIASLIAHKLGISLFEKKASEVPPPNSASWIGQVEFDYESFDGRYVIGDGFHSFETSWSNSGDGSIHVYNYGANINGVAVARGISQFEDLKNVSNLDFTSRSRTVSTGEFVVYRNKHGLYAVLHILDVKARQGQTNASLRFFYVINKDGGLDFSEFSIFD